MAISRNGSNGQVVGRFGSVFGYMLNGQNIIRGPRRSSTRNITDKVRDQQLKQRVAGKFSSYIRSIINYGYQQVAASDLRIGGFQMAQKHIYHEAMDVDAAHQHFLNPEKLLVSRGPIFPPIGIHVEKVEHAWHFSWLPNPSNLYCRLNIAYFNFNSVVDLKLAVADAMDGNYVLPLSPFVEMQKDCHIYAFFSESFSHDLSDSVYCGVI